MEAQASSLLLLLCRGSSLIIIMILYRLLEAQASVLLFCFGGSNLCIIILLWRLEPLHYYFSCGGSSVQNDHNDLRRSSSLFIIFYHSWLLFSDPVIAEQQERDSLAIERGEFRLCMSMLFMRQNLEKKNLKILTTTDG
jgi:hypothetical protein